MQEHGTEEHSTQEHHPHIVPVSTYLLVFGALLVGTAATVWAATIDLGRFNLIMALAIACTKASLVVLFFMHVAYSSRLTKAILISGFCTLLILFFFTSIDLSSRGWVGVPGR
jgi:cytochrome c oxidase subunit 4